jgi:hypothetical protein
MTHADPIAEDTRPELKLWMLPLILFQMICSFFTNERQFIRDHRRKRSSLTNWEDHILDLVEAEWNIDALKAEGARRLLAGDPLDFQTIRIPPPPDDWQPLVQDAADLLRRFEAVAGFHADPETYIRRHAARISDRERANTIHSPAWFDRRPFGPAHHEGYIIIAGWSPHGYQLALAKPAQAPVEPRGRRSLISQHVHAHPP